MTGATREVTVPVTGVEAKPRALFDRWWPLLAVVVFPFVIVLNYDALGMQGIYPDYVCFKRIIASGFDAAPQPGCTTPTFPMWGYGWLLFVTESKVVLLVLQNVVAIAAIWFFVRALEDSAVLDGTGARLLKLLVVVSLPWYALHALRWPYSIAVSLVLVSLALLMRGVARGGAKWSCALAGACFGLALNFRSDYYLFPLVVAALLLVWRDVRLAARAQRAALWLVSAYLLLVPWALYSHHVTGHFLLTSTNAGHVLYISLGNLPGNRWGITPVDGDPRMRAEVRARFGHDRTLVYESDVFLRDRWRQLVRDHPLEFARKLGHNLLAVPREGVYFGEFLEERDCQPGCLARYHGGAVRPGTALRVWRDGALGVEQQVRFAVWSLATVEGLLLPPLAFVLFPVFLVAALRRRWFGHLLIGLLFGYQIALNTFAYTMASYTANIYVLMLVVLAWAGQSLRARLGRTSAQA